MQFPDYPYDQAYVEINLKLKNKSDNEKKMVSCHSYRLSVIKFYKTETFGRKFYRFLFFYFVKEEIQWTSPSSPLIVARAEVAKTPDLCIMY